jgi:hypothetical protein
MITSWRWSLRFTHSGQLSNEVGPILLVKLIDKARTIQLLEKLDIDEIFGIRSLGSLGHRIISHFDFAYIGNNGGQ